MADPGAQNAPVSGQAAAYLPMLRTKWQELRGLGASEQGVARGLPSLLWRPIDEWTQADVTGYFSSPERMRSREVFSPQVHLVRASVTDEKTGDVVCRCVLKRCALFNDAKSREFLVNKADLHVNALHARALQRYERALEQGRARGGGERSRKRRHGA